MNELVEKIRSIGFMNGVADLHAMHELVEEISKTKNGRLVIPSMFQFFEEHAYKDIGSPGPFVHFIEEANDYNELLVSSIKRKPTFITIWMVNRILNGSLAQKEREIWLNLMRDVEFNPTTDKHIKEAVNGFLKHQQERAT